MASIPVQAQENVGQPPEGEVNGQFIRVIVADTQAIFRAGLRKIFALEDDVRVVGQAETLSQTFSAAKKFSADMMLFEAALAPNPVEAVSDLLRQNPALRASRGHRRARRRTHAGTVPPRRACHCIAGSRAGVAGGLPAQSIQGRTLAGQPRNSVGDGGLSHPEARARDHLVPKYSSRPKNR